MNESMSLLLATVILSIGGLSLYMYKSEESAEEDYNEDSIFNLNESSFDELPELEEEEDDDYEVYQPKNKKRNIKTKTKRNKKSSGSKRRY
jgi:hypothetical protein